MKAITYFNATVITNEWLKSIRRTSVFEQAEALDLAIEALGQKSYFHCPKCGTIRLEKAVGINSKAALDYMEKKQRGERALIVEGIVFTQRGDATLEKHTYR